MDLYRDGLRLARSRGSAPLVVGDALAPPFAPVFDLVCLFDVIEHLDDEAGVLEAARELLKPGGRLLVTVPAHRRLWSYADEYADHRRRYSRQELVSRLQEAGFGPPSTGYFMAPLLPAMWLGRRLAARRARGAGAAEPTVAELARREYRPPRLLNTLAELALAPEAMLARRGLALPLGTSLLAVAQSGEEAARPNRRR
jgi:SAM-dependent methyltransferase